MEGSPAEYTITSAQDFGYMIRNRRRDLKLSQEMICAMTGISQPNLSLIERGRASAQIDTCLKIAEALGIDIVGQVRS